VFLHYNVLLA